jgi:hypothetical protein
MLVAVLAPYAVLAGAFVVAVVLACAVITALGISFDRERG